jgi:hypothetical protein
MDPKGAKPVVRPPTFGQGPGSVNAGAGGAPTVPGAAIDNLIAGMDAIRQETIESRDMNHNANNSSGIGKDVSAIIGLIEKKGLAAPAEAQLAAATASTNISKAKPRNVSCPASSTRKHTVNDVEKSGPTSTAHDFGGSRATPKTQRSSRSGAGSGRVASASAKVNATTSAKTLTEARQADPKKSGKTRGDVPLRPSSSLYRPTTASTTKGASTGPSTKLKPTKSFSTIRAKMGDAAGDSADKPAAKEPTLKDQFAAFSRFGDKSSDGKEISLTNSDKWMKQAHVIDGKKITTTDTSITFKKHFKTAKKINFEDFKKFIEDLAASKKIEPKEIEDKLINCGRPGLSSATKAAHAGVVERLTDTSKYTGSHKERFDSTGRGRGIEGRRDMKDTSGYTAAFKTKLGDKSDGSGSTSPSPSPVPPTK